MSLNDPLDLSSATPATEGTRLPQGRYDLIVDRVIQKMTTAGLAVIIEYRTLRGSDPNTPPGSMGSCYIGFKYPDSAKGQILSFIAALGGIKSSDEAGVLQVRPHSTAILKAAVGPANVLAGMVVHAEIVTKISQQSGKPFGLHVWHPVAPPEAAQLGIPAPTLPALLARIQGAPGLPPSAPVLPPAPAPYAPPPGVHAYTPNVVPQGAQHGPAPVPADLPPLPPGWRYLNGIPVQG